MVKKALAAAFCALLLTASTAGAWWTAPANREWSPNDTYWDDHWLPDPSTSTFVENSYDFCVATGTCQTDEEWVSVADSNDFSPGNGSADSAFSVGCWIKPDNMSSKHIISKDDNTNREWSFQYDNGSDLGLWLWDDSVGGAGYIGREVLLASQHVGTWVHVMATYSAATGGESAADDIDIYIDCVASDNNTNNGAGTYVAMENLGAPLGIGVGAGVYFDGNIGVCFYASDVVSEAECASLQWKNCAGIDSTIDNVDACWDLAVDTDDDVGSHDGVATNGVLPSSPADYPTP